MPFSLGSAPKRCTTSKIVPLVDRHLWWSVLSTCQNLESRGEDLLACLGGIILIMLLERERPTACAAPFPGWGILHYMKGKKKELIINMCVIIYSLWTHCDQLLKFLKHCFSCPDRLWNYEWEQALFFLISFATVFLSQQLEKKLNV